MYRIDLMQNVKYVSTYLELPAVTFIHDKFSNFIVIIIRPAGRIKHGRVARVKNMYVDSCISLELFLQFSESHKVVGSFNAHFNNNCTIVPKSGSVIHVY